MSERKSWDIQPKRRAPAAPPPIERTQPVVRERTTPARSPQPQRQVLKAQPKEKPMPEPQAQAIRSKLASQVSKEREPLKARRRRARRRAFWTFIVVSLVLVIGVIGSFWWNGIRIQTINAAGPDSDGMKSIATNVLAGTYHFVIPHNSIFFFPENAIRAQVLQQYPDISAVSISRSSFNSITIVSIPREAALTWCGDTYSTQPIIIATTTSATATSTAAVMPAATPTCYSADAQGVIFASITDPATIAQTLRIYGPLANSGDENTSPLGTTIAQANLIPNALQFIKELKSLGVPVVAFVIRGDEADLYAQSGTRITYVLGREEVTTQVAESAFPSLNLDDGSLEYVDLRFEGKAYFKKVGSDQANAATSTGSGQ